MAAALQIQGSRESGQDVRGQNVTAVAAIANIVKSSLGPVGLDKVCFVHAIFLQHKYAVRLLHQDACFCRCWWMTLEMLPSPTTELQY